MFFIVSGTIAFICIFIIKDKLNDLDKILNTFTTQKNR